MTKGMMGILFSGLVAVGVTAAATTKPAKDSVTCSLTGKTVQECCCVQKDGKLYCTLAQKTIDDCCCRPADK